MALVFTAYKNVSYTSSELIVYADRVSYLAVAPCLVIEDYICVFGDNL